MVRKIISLAAATSPNNVCGLKRNKANIKIFAGKFQIQFSQFVETFEFY